MKSFAESFLKNISPEMGIILAVSGWVDSMVMLDLALKNHLKEKIIVAHFNHALRGEESDNDELFIEKFCEERGLIFSSEKMNIESLAREEKMSIEAVARKYRYAFLLENAKKYNAQYILTAHHLDDRIETWIFNFIRGTKLWGLSALSYRHEIEKGTFLLRPLITCTKNEILAYADENHIQYREDSTNSDTKYLRNHLRYTILPEYEKINPEYRNAIRDFIDYTEEVKSWIDDEVQEFLWWKKSFSVQAFSNTSSFFQKEIIRYLYEQAHSGTVGLSQWNIDELLRYILTADGGTEKKLWKLILTKAKNIISY